MALYAAYGSNLDPAQMLRRAPNSPTAGAGWLIGWRLTFGGESLGWDGALVTVVEDEIDQVFVMLYDLTSADEVRLDGWEGGALNLYRKVHVLVQTMEGTQPAWLYVLDAYEGGLPSSRTVGLLADAAESGGAPADYVHRLRSRPCS